MEIAVICIYISVLLGIGFYYSRKIANFDDFSVAGRNIAWPLLLATSAATMIGGGASMGSVGKVFTYGTAGGIAACGWYLSMIYSGHYIAPKLRKLKFITVADLFGHYYGEFASYLIGVISLIFCLGIIAAQVAAMGKILEATVGIPFLWAALIGAAVVIFYATLGGMWAVIQTDVIQFLLLVIGLSVAAIVGVQAVGGYGELLSRLPEGFSSPAGTWGWTKLGSVFVAYFFGEMFAPFYVQRMYAAKDERTARIGMMWSGIFMLFFMPVTVITLGFVATVLIPGVESQHALSAVIRHLFPGPLSAVFVAAMMACMMSSCDSILNSCSTIFVRDFYQKLSSADLSPRRILTIARLTTVVFGGASLVLALWIPNVIDWLLYSYSLWAPAAILPIVIGLSRRYSPNMTYAVVASIISGCICSAVWLAQSLWMPPSLDSLWPWSKNLDAAVVGLAVAVAVFLISLLVTRNIPLVKGFIPACTRDREAGGAG